MQKRFLNMCKVMFKRGGLDVYILQVVHIYYLLGVAKKVTLFLHTHIHSTAIPHIIFSRDRGVSSYPVKKPFSTLSTDTTTTIFKLVTIRRVEQKNSSLTISSLNLYN